MVKNRTRGNPPGGNREWAEAGRFQYGKFDWILWAANPVEGSNWINLKLTRDGQAFGRSNYTLSWCPSEQRLAISQQALALITMRPHLARRALVQINATVSPIESMDAVMQKPFGRLNPDNLPPIMSFYGPNGRRLGLQWFHSFGRLPRG